MKWYIGSFCTQAIITLKGLFGKASLWESVDQNTFFTVPMWRAVRND